MTTQQGASEAVSLLSELRKLAEKWRKKSTYYERDGWIMPAEAMETVADEADNLCDRFETAQPNWREPLEALAEKWETLYRESTYAHASAIKQCADELRAVIEKLVK